MADDVKLTFSDLPSGAEFTFEDLEIPESITFGGEQKLVVHEFVGGGRVVDAMGRSDMPLEWSGIVQGEKGLGYALYLNYLRIKGAPFTLTWSTLNYTVVIKEFKCTFQGAFKYPYHIVCEVVSDNSAPVTSPHDYTITEAIQADNETAADLTESVTATAATDTSAIKTAKSGLSSAISSLSTAIKAVSSFATATKAQIDAVLTPLAEARAYVKTLIASASNTLANVTTLGGVLPNNALSVNVGNLSNSVNAMTSSAKLYDLQSVLGRMGVNINLSK